MIILYLLYLFGKSEETDLRPSDYPKISVLIPCYNEEDLVKIKVDNTKLLEYPKEKLEIIFLDGCSTDKTVSKIKNEIKNLENFRLIQTNRTGKINQINFILPKLKSEIVVITDMDANLKENVLTNMISIYETDEDISVVGANVFPKNCIELETQYWSNQNHIRIVESSVHSSSIVIAPCYSFKRKLIEKFPEDCIADDIYISFLANSLGKKSKYDENIIAYETRTPQNLDDLLKHKFRKGNAYILELLRFLYLLPNMLPRWKVIYLTKFIQVILIPWIIPFFLLSSISLILSGIGYLKIVIFSFAFLFISLLITHGFFTKRRKIHFSGKYKRRSLLALFLITNFVLIINGLTYPFYHQTSRYTKIKSP
jgi:cellulose synthase/poly-beta-1,6-N-acetylglucosamine synthase-like glycosyltransferase